MEKGQMRVEVNISIKKPEEKELGTKVEVKNINSINAAARSVNYEIQRQTELLDSDKKIIQETRGWDENKQQTFSQRLKEGSADYRYFPEPDLPPMKFSKDEVEEIRLGLPELPAARRKRFKGEYGLNNSQIEIFTIAPKFGNYFENVASELTLWDNLKHLKNPGEEHRQKLFTLAANYMITEFPVILNMSGMEINELEGIKITPESFADLIVRIFHNEVSSTRAKTGLSEMGATGAAPADVIEKLNLGQVSDKDELQKIVEGVVKSNAKAVEDYKKKKTEVLKFLVGCVMAETKGKANPKLVMEILIEKLGQPTDAIILPPGDNWWHDIPKDYEKYKSDELTHSLSKNATKTERMES